MGTVTNLKAYQANKAAANYRQELERMNEGFSHALIQSNLRMLDEREALLAEIAALKAKRPRTLRGRILGAVRLLMGRND